MPSFGETLRRERELRQISLREISESTKINLRYLEALERDDFRHLPGGVFNKGFVRAYAQYIGVDPESMVNAYLDEERLQRDRLAARAEPVVRRTAPEIVRPAPPPPDASRRRIRLAAALVLALAALAIASVAAAVKLGYAGRWIGGHPGASSMVARVEVARMTTGSLRCGAETPVTLDGLEPGTILDLPCDGALVVEAQDAGAVLVGFGDGPRRPLGGDGESVHGRLIERPARGGR